MNNKLTIALSFAAIAAVAAANTVVPTSAQAGSLRIVHEYPNSAIDDSLQPVFAADVAWSKSGGTDVRKITSQRASDSQAATLHNLEDGGGPVADDSWQGSVAANAIQAAANGGSAIAADGQDGTQVLHDLEDGGGPEAEDGI